MRKVAWVSAALLVPCLALAREFGAPLGILLNDVEQIWWTLPLSTSVASVLVLATIVTLGNFGGKKNLSRLLSSAYLVVGPSSGALNMLASLSLGDSPPTWVECLMPVLLVSSAWIYYQSLENSDLGQETDLQQVSPFEVILFPRLERRRQPSLV